METLPEGYLLGLQRTAGNRTAAAWLREAALQREPTAGRAQDQPTTAGVDFSAARPEDLPVLRLHERRAEVVLLKQKLVEQGGMDPVSGPPSEIYDDATYRTVRRFQWRFGLPPDGLVGARTWTVLLGPPSLDLLSPESISAFGPEMINYGETLAQGQANRAAHGDWGGAAPVNARPGDYGDTWARDEASVKVGGDLNWRYNNPGNILPGYKEHSYGAYRGALNVAALSGLAIFPTMEAGWEALHGLLLSSLYVDLTLDKVFEKYVGTPAGHKSAYGDDPDAYLRSVIGTTGLHASTRVRDLDASDLDALMHAIRKVEGTREGHAYQPGDALPPLLARVFG